MPRSLPAVAERLRGLFLVAPVEEHSSVAQSLTQGTYNPGRRGAVALACLGVVAALVAGVVLLRGRPSEQPLVVPPVAGGTSAAALAIVVDVEGKVRRPGLVFLPDGARVADALKAAGGVLPGVSTASINLARKVSDGEQVLVGLDPASGSVGGSATAGGTLDLNLATAEQLDALPGIGPVLAERIIEWRTEHGRFASVDQLREVPGIGEAKYSSMKSKVRV